MGQVGIFKGDFSLKTLVFSLIPRESAALSFMFKLMGQVHTEHGCYSATPD